MTGPISDDDLHAYVDGALPPERAQAVEHWLEANPADAERVRLWNDQIEGLHRLFDPVLDEPVPPRLTAALKPGRAAVLRRLAGVAAAILLIAIGGAGGWWLRGAAHGGVQMASLPTEALAAHVVFASEVRHPVEVAASDQAHLVGWLSKRLGTQLEVPDLSGQGFSLVGGRLLPASDGPAAQFMYEDAAGQRLTLYIRSGGQAAPTAFRFASQQGAQAFYWLDGGFGYALAGNIPRDRLMPIAHTVHRQFED